MNRVQLVLLALKPKVRAFGFNQKELKGIAARIADNLQSDEEASEEERLEFQEYLQKEMKNTESGLYDALTGVQYTYNMDLTVYTKDPDGKIVLSDAEKLLTQSIQENMGMDMSAMLDMRNNMTANFGGRLYAARSTMRWPQSREAFRVMPDFLQMRAR